MNKKQLVYDLPTRLFHWVFAALFLLAFGIAKTLEDFFPYHMLAGFLLVFTVLLRLVWGVIGTRYARFRSFALQPKELVTYFSTLLSADKRKWAGHNPASSWATLMMFALALGLGITGFLMTRGQREALEGIHEWLANGFLIVVLLHIGGVLFHAFRHRDAVFVTMLDGKKTGVPQTEPIPLHPIAGLVFLASVAAFATYLSLNFDRQKSTLQILGTTLELEEEEENKSNNH